MIFRRVTAADCQCGPLPCSARRKFGACLLGYRQVPKLFPRRKLDKPCTTHPVRRRADSAVLSDQTAAWGQQRLVGGGGHEVP
jgi:hypothetical protein